MIRILDRTGPMRFFALVPISILSIACTSADPADDGTTEDDLTTGFMCSARPYVGGSANDAPAAIVDVRATAQTGFDRFVLEFSGGIPSYYVMPLPDATFPTTIGNAPVQLRGAAGIVVGVAGSGRDLEDPMNGPRTYKGPERFATPEMPQMKEAALTTELSDFTDWSVGLADIPCFRVTELTSPPRLIIDVKAAPPPPSTQGKSCGDLTGLARQMCYDVLLSNSKVWEQLAACREKTGWERLSCASSLWCTSNVGSVPCR